MTKDYLACDLEVAQVADFWFNVCVDPLTGSWEEKDYISILTYGCFTLYALNFLRYCPDCGRSVLKLVSMLNSIENETNSILGLGIKCTTSISPRNAGKRFIAFVDKDEEARMSFKSKGFLLSKQAIPEYLYLSVLCLTHSMVESRKGRTEELARFFRMVKACADIFLEIDCNGKKSLSRPILLEGAELGIAVKVANEIFDIR